MALKSSSRFDFSDLREYLRNHFPVDCYEEVYEAVDEVSKEAVKKLRAASRAQFGSGDYAKGWRRKIERGRLRCFVTVYGTSPTYKLAHLLEHGHLTRNGTGRQYPPTPAHPHIAEVEEWAVDEALDRAVSKLEKRL